MPKRIEVIRNTLRRKKTLDYSLKNKKYSAETIVELQKIIGESTFFKKPENDNRSQALRHYIWKAQKSIGLLEDNLSRYFEGLDVKIVEELESSGIPLRDTALAITRNSKDVVDVYQVLDGGLIREAECLKNMFSAFEKMSDNNLDKNTRDEVETLFKKNLYDYFLAVADEERFMNEITKMMKIHANQAERLINSVNKYMLKQNVKDRKDALGYVADFLTLITGITFFISFGVSTYQSMKEGQSLQPDTITTSIALLEATLLVARRIVLGTIQSAPSKKMLSLLQKIDWLV
jgi:hypothetical protein